MKIDNWWKEAYNENVMEVCGRCLRVRITLYNWVQPSEDLVKVFVENKKFKVLTLCHRCLKEIYNLKTVVVIQMCKCGMTYHTQKKTWFPISEKQRKNLNGMIKKGEIEVRLTTCPGCKK